MQWKMMESWQGDDMVLCS